MLCSITGKVKEIREDGILITEEEELVDVFVCNYTEECI